VRERIIEILVGFFMLFGILALLVLAFKVSGLTSAVDANGYNITAVFDNVGGLKIRSPVSLAGVHIGEVSAIKLDNVQYKALVTMKIDSKYKKLPVDTSASISNSRLIRGKLY